MNLAYDRHWRFLITNVLRFSWHLAVGLGLVLLLSDAGLLCCHADPHQAPPADRMTLTYKPLSGGQIVLLVRLDGHTPARFILDTGTNYCMITDALAAKLRLVPQPSPAHIDGKQAKIVTVPMFQIGTIRYPNIQMAIVPESNLYQGFGASVDGIIGVDALLDVPVFIDFQRHLVTLFYCSPVTNHQLRSLNVDVTSSVPLIDRAGELDFRSVVELANGRRKASVSLTVDTGAETTSIPKATGRALKLNLDAPSYDLDEIFSKTGVNDVFLSSLSFDLRGTKIKRVTVQCARAAVMPHSFELGVGLDVLSHFRVLFDFRAKKMYLKLVSVANVFQQKKAMPRSSPSLARPRRA